MNEDPRKSRLEDEEKLMDKLQADSSIVEIRKENRPNFPAERYLIVFHGKGLMLQGDRVVTTEQHHAMIELGADWPQRPPQVYWLTPIFHPNFKHPNVCLQGKPYSSTTHLDMICETLWDMLTFKKFNTRLDAHGRWDNNAAEWVLKNKDRLPTDNRELRNLAITIRIISSDSKPRE